MKTALSLEFDLVLSFSIFISISTPLDSVKLTLAVILNIFLNLSQQVLSLLIVKFRIVDYFSP